MSWRGVKGRAGERLTDEFPRRPLRPEASCCAARRSRQPSTLLAARSEAARSEGEAGRGEGEKTHQRRHIEQRELNDGAHEGELFFCLPITPPPTRQKQPAEREGASAPLLMRGGSGAYRWSSSPARSSSCPSSLGPLRRCPAHAWVWLWGERRSCPAPAWAWGCGLLAGASAASAGPYKNGEGTDHA